MTLAAVLVLTPLQLCGQRRPPPRQGQGQSRGIELTPIVGWQMGGKLRVRDGDVRIPSELVYGGLLNVPLSSGAMLELMYSRQETILELKEFTGIKRTLFDMTVHYAQIGAVYEAVRSPGTKAFGVLTAGATIFDPKEAGTGSEWRFSFAGGLGGKKFFSPRVGLRADARLQFTFISSAGSAWCGAGGCVVGLSGTVVAQLATTAGLVIKF
ncbi:MAG: hypothetical protein O7I93_12930 [Gemmatimonadetes bacterium]|nr:hypothetical protein [Gemmatimonadota bacterium]